MALDLWHSRCPVVNVKSIYTKRLTPVDIEVVARMLGCPWTVSGLWLRGHIRRRLTMAIGSMTMVSIWRWTESAYVIGQEISGVRWEVC